MASPAKRRIARGVVLVAFVDSTKPRICPEVGLVVPASSQSPAVDELIET